jgi:hypothetical protein
MTRLKGAFRINIMESIQIIMWRPCSFSPIHISLVQWVNCLLPTWGEVVHIPGMHPHSQWNRVLLFAMSRYIGDPDMIPDN